MTNPPIGKAPNDGGGDMDERQGKECPFHVAKSFEAERRNILYFGDLAINEFQSDEVAKAVAADANDQFRYWAKSRGWVGPKERDTLKSKLSEAEKALDEIASWNEGNVVTTSFDEPESARVARKALSRLRADGGGRGEEKSND